MAECEMDARLKEILACPACDERPPVEHKDCRLVCPLCHRAYPIRDGIPVMLEEEATIEE